MPPSPTVQLPEYLGRYRILKQLGQGGMGSVYLAQDTELDRPVAVKIPHLDDSEGSNVLERFNREARTIATLRHPNICPLYDIGDHQGTPYLIMAFIEGKSLANYLRDKRPSQRQSAILVRKAALALQEAHQRGIIHRDLKPANIMIDRRGEPIVMDFGLARRLSQTDAKLTQSGAVIGTPAYMPPEQISSSSETMGPGCDIYSLGIILYELLTGRLPFHGDVMGMLAQILTEAPPRPSSVAVGIDPQLEAICLKAIAKKPRERFASMQEMANQLLDYLRGTPASEPQATTVCQVPQETREEEMRLSMLGGMRSMAQAGRQMGVARPAKEKKLTRRKRRKSGRLLWAAMGGGALVVLLAGVFLVRPWLNASNNQASLTAAQPKGEMALVSEANPQRQQQPTVTQPEPAAEQKPDQKTGRDQSESPRLEAPDRPPENTASSPTTSANTKSNPGSNSSKTVAAGSKTTIPRGQWTRVEPERGNAWPWDNNNTRAYQSITGGTVKLWNAGMSWQGIRSKNISFRCQVLIEGQRAAISVRDLQGNSGYGFECYRFADGMCLLSIGMMNNQNTYQSLREIRRKVNTSEFISMRITTENDLITAYLNGQKVLEVRDNTKVRAGKPGISAYHSQAQYKNLEVMLLDE